MIVDINQPLWRACSHFTVVINKLQITREFGLCEVSFPVTLKMCRKYALIYNIDNTNIQELCDYLSRLKKIYLIFMIISLVNLITEAVPKQLSTSIIAAVNILLYLINIIILQRASNDHTVMNANLAIFGLLLISAFNIFSLIYNAVTGNLWTIFGVVSVVLQWSTIFLIYKLREKIINGENTPHAVPVQAYAEPV